MQSFRGGDICYWGEFVSREEEERLLHQVGSRRWVQMGSGRRVQMYGGDPGDGSSPMVPVRLPDFLRRVVARLPEAEVRRANHVLVNQYPAGTGILAHQDGPLYEACFVILSLESPLVLRFEAHVDHAHRLESASVLLEARSLLLVRGEAYANMLHGIEEHEGEERVPADCLNAKGGTTICRGASRTSFTIRRVKRVLSSKLFKF